MPRVVVTTVAARKIEDKWEAALISDGRFVRALNGKDLFKLVSPLLLPYLQSAHPNDTEVGINISVTVPDPSEAPQ